MNKRQSKATKKEAAPKAQEEAHRATPANDGETAHAMREASKPKAHKADGHTLEDVIALLNRHGIRFNEE